MKTNTKSAAPAAYTHEGAVAARTSVRNQLRRAVMSCLLYEGQFYENGVDIAARITELVKANKPEDVAAIAVEAREKMKLRHVPLLLACEMSRYPEHRRLVIQTLEKVVQRPDELAEVLAIYWRNGGRRPVSNPIKRGLARAFTRFDEFSLSRYNTDADITLRDVMFICHPKPKDKAQARLWKRLVDGKLKTAGTWETELSAGADKKATFERLIKEEKLGALALLRNLRGMTEAGVDRDVIVAGLRTMKVEKILPYRFIAAAQYAPQFEPQLEEAMFRCLEGAEPLPGLTQLLVDVSGSMDHALSGKSDLTRIDAACGLAILLREICEDVQIYTFSRETVTVPPRRGFALRDAIKASQPHTATHLGSALDALKYGAGATRLVVISDEQSADKVGAPQTRGYMLNVASYQNGVGYGRWNHIDGFSESCVRFISELERGEQDED